MSTNSFLDAMQPAGLDEDQWQSSYNLQPGTQAGSQADAQGAGLDPSAFTLPGQHDEPVGAGAAGAGAGAAGAPAPGAGAAGAGAGADYSVIQGYQTKLQAVKNARNPQEKAVAQDQLAREVYASLSKAGHDVKWDGDQLIVDGRPYVVGDGGGGDNTAMAAAAPAPAPAAGGVDPGSWMPSGQSGYTPGAIPMDDIPAFSYEQLLAQTGNPAEDAAMSRFLENPYSMDDRTVGMMKAKSKDELAEMELENQDRLRTLGSDYGIDESPWLAAQQLDSRRATDRGIVESNRAIDMTAAQTRKGDEAKALGLSMDHTNAKASRAFQAASTVLSAAAARGDRLALRESVQQQAAALNISAQQLLATHINAKLDRDLRGKISADELAQADQHHLETLALQLEQLDQTDAQFKAKFQLDSASESELERHNKETERNQRDAMGF